jgi:hypothetical protein
LVPVALGDTFADLQSMVAAAVGAYFEPGKVPVRMRLGR